MMQHLLSRLPGPFAHPSPLVAVAATVVGVVLWLAGGRFSRGLVTLSLVAAGAWLGLHLPRWMNLSLREGGPSLGVVGALALGAAGYFLDRACTGLLLGLLLALWAGVTVWIALVPAGSAHDLVWPALHWTSDPIDLVAQLRRGLPADLGRTLPAACGCGMAAGVLLALLWPRWGRAILFSLLGVSFVLAVGLPGTALHRPGWLAGFPATAQAQTALLVGLVVAGTLIQWAQIRAAERKPRPAREKAQTAAGESADPADHKAPRTAGRQRPARIEGTDPPADRPRPRPGSGARPPQPAQPDPAARGPADVRPKTRTTL